MGSSDDNICAYESDFELAMLTNTSAYYSRKAASWIQKDSCLDYMLKAEECLKREKEKVDHYLHASSKQKLLEKVQHELLSLYENQLLEQEHSGCHALLRHDKIEDLSRMYRLFCQIPKDLQPVVAIFRQHVINEGIALIKQAEDAANNEKAEKKDMRGGLDQDFVMKIIVLHDKYLQYVGECFFNHSTFVKAFKDAFEPVAAIFRQHIIDEGTALVKQAEDAASNKKAEKKDMHGGQDQAFVRKIIELHDNYIQYLSESFVNKSLLHKALKKAFEVFCDRGVVGRTSAELLANFCDYLLKKGGNENLGDETIEHTLETVVKLLAYIRDKDLFAHYDCKKLAQRLLFDKSAKDDHKRHCLTKLTQQFGGHFTSKMEGMVTDLTLTQENQTPFEDYLTKNASSNSGIDMSVTVLTTGFWPNYKSSNLALPAEMVKCTKIFEEFYQLKTKHQKLRWMYSLGTCNINGNFELRKIELIVTTCQAGVLLLFNSAERLSYANIKEHLNLTDEDIVYLLHSLSCAEHKILNKDPSTKMVHPGDYFEVNSTFTNKKGLIKISLPGMGEKKKVIEDFDNNRCYTIDAFIIRKMKSRRVLPHQQLVLECVEQPVLMFKPDFKSSRSALKT